MKNILRILPALLLPAALNAQTVQNMQQLSEAQKAAAINLTLTGELTTSGNSDFRQLRDLCWQLQTVDLSQARCTGLPDNAFHSRHRLRSVLLPAALRNIGSQSFFACTALRSASVPASVESIGESAFSGCSALTMLTIEGTPRIGAFAFQHCDSLRTITLLSKRPPVCDATAFESLPAGRCRLVVPKGSEKAYKKAAGWSRFFVEPQRTFAQCNAEEVLVPQPASLTVDGSAAALSVLAPWSITAADGLSNEAQIASGIIAERIAPYASPTNVTVQLSLSLDASLADDEAYTLSVSQEGVQIAGRTAAGVFYGLMTLDQLLRGDASAPVCQTIPALRIADAPRTHIRELMLDPARTFIPFEEVKKFVPEMARYKFNSLHLHLVDDQAWRIEIKTYPELTAVGSARIGMDDMKVPSAGFYTQNQMRELVAFAARYHVQVVPEIEMPGHEVAAVHCFPQLTCGSKLVPIRTTCGVSDELLCPGSEFTYEFLGNVFRELADVFPSPYVHLGGDEAGNPALGCWTDCEKCRALKRRLGIEGDDRADNWRLQKYLFDAVIDTLRTKYGKTPMFWYETDFKEIQPGCVTFAWRHGLTRTAAEAAIRNNARIMLCPGEHCYFDYPLRAGDMPEVNWGMPTISLKQAYALDPSWGLGEEFEKNNLFGVAGTLWSECINTPERIYYQAYPRSHALAEVGWTPAARRSYADFLKRLRPVLVDMQRRGITFSRAF